MSSAPDLKTHRRVVIRRTGGPDVLTIVEEPIPNPGPGQARVKVLAADVSFSDVNIRAGRYPGAPKPPFTPGYAVVGIVDALGARIASPAVGKSVAALTFVGGYSQYLCLPADQLVAVPDGIDPAEAVVMVLNHVAAHQMLHRVGRVVRGQRILVHGAAGGVGSAFLELARVAGVQAIGTASKPKHGLVERLGAIAVDYRSEDFVDRVRTLTDGAGVDCVFDPLGSAHLRRSVLAVRRRGTVVGYGYYEAARKGLNPLADVLRQYLWLTVWSLPPSRKRVAFYDIRTLKRRHPEWFRVDLAALLELLAKGMLRPTIAYRLPLDEVVRAHELVEQARVEGKVVLLPSLT